MKKSYKKYHLEKELHNCKIQFLAHQYPQKEHNHADLRIYLKGIGNLNKVSKKLERFAKAKGINFESIDFSKEFQEKWYEIGETRIELSELKKLDEIGIIISTTKDSIQEGFEKTFKIYNQLKLFLDEYNIKGLDELISDFSIENLKECEVNSGCLRPLSDLVKEFYLSNKFLRKTKQFIADVKSKLNENEFDNLYENRLNCEQFINSIRTTDEAIVDAMADLITAKEKGDQDKIKQLVKLIKGYAVSLNYDATKDIKRILEK